MTKKEQYRPDQAAQEATWVHGCFAEDTEKILEAVKGQGCIGEVCCTRPEDPEYYGKIGVYLKGKVVAMFTQDVYSSWHESLLYREASPEMNKFRVEKYSDLKPSNLDGEDPGYTESWVIPHEVVGIWVFKSYATSKATRIIERVSEFKKLGLPITVIEDRHL